MKCDVFTRGRYGHKNYHGHAVMFFTAVVVTQKMQLRTKCSRGQCIFGRGIADKHIVINRVVWSLRSDLYFCDSFIQLLAFKYHLESMSHFFQNVFLSRSDN